MVQRAEREPSMEEIVVALRETRRDADRLRPFGGATQSAASGQRKACTAQPTLRTCAMPRSIGYWRRMRASMRGSWLC